MKRRDLLLLLAGATIARLPAAQAQQQPKTWLVGYLAAFRGPRDEVFRRAMRDLGYVEGQNVRILFRWADNGSYETLARELVSLQVDVIAAVASPAVQAAKDATQTTPIVFWLVGDPVGYGFIPSLAHPGGNITGLSTQLSDFMPKVLEVIRDLLPRAAKLAILGDPTNPGHKTTLAMIISNSDALGFSHEFYAVSTFDQLSPAFSAILQQHPDALFVFPNPFAPQIRKRIIEFASDNRLVAAYALKDYVSEGGLISLGPNRDDITVRAAAIVDKILHGASPADIPVEQPTSFELAINLKTAKQLSLAIPSLLLARANEVIE